MKISIFNYQQNLNNSKARINQQFNFEFQQSKLKRKLIQQNKAQSLNILNDISWSNILLDNRHKFLGTQNINQKEFRLITIKIMLYEMDIHLNKQQ
ncbi:unnamed protein product [Paramecium sonneborni]|uniref:Uncharacterized protein n=1 Tax=Paramecium sonneborni TaxID=65129 RepID=A0A8S1R8U8_9CILI|nr:unnamed protein product [Paramecium sonneborni]